MTRWYELSFPRAMKSGSAQSAIEAILASGARWSMGPVEATVFETIADDSGIRHRVRSSAPTVHPDTDGNAARPTGRGGRRGAS